MDKNLSKLQPKLVWKHFSAITNIPRPSYHEEQMRQYIVDFAKSHGLECSVDEAHNVHVAKPATKGMENRKGIVLQAHTDMVPQKNNDKVFDFEKDPIEAYIDGEWVTANGTTLGADDGIGVACALAVLEDDTIQHGPIEALFTATEETGMDGAFGLKAGVLNGDILLNMDSETEGELYVGCAGGLDANITFDYKAAAVTTGCKAYTVEVKGLRGGHSGIQIGYQRANANRTLCRLLYHLPLHLELCSIDGGGLRNAIPREAVATVLVKNADCKAFEQGIAQAEKEIKAEYKGVEEDEMSIACAATTVPSQMIPHTVAENLIRAVIAAPDGVIKMSKSMEGLVQTSTNLARVVSDGKSIKIQCLLRSSVGTEKVALGEAMRALFEMAGAKVELTGSYDGWNPDMSSPILKAMLLSYEELYGVRPAVTAIHAGLECGIIGGKYPEMDMISFGPTICYPHSPDEKVNITSVEKFYDFLLHTLKNAPVK